jgi:iron complex transport system ATP-binding protein
VISGGGSGQDLINVLYHRGYQLSLGVLNAGDTDWQYAKSLKIPISEEKPFSGISDRAAKKNREMLIEADLVIMTNVPIGSGNLRNLKMASESLEQGKKVYYLRDREYEEFDYTGGEATELLASMINNGLSVVDSMEQLLREIS